MFKQGSLVFDCRSNFKCFRYDGNQHVDVCTFKPSKKRTQMIMAIRSIKLQIIMLQVLFKFLKTSLYYYKLQEQIYFCLTKGKQRI